jgi:hypothetical protein
MGAEVSISEMPHTERKTSCDACGVDRQHVVETVKFLEQTIELLSYKLNKRS